MGPTESPRPAAPSFSLSLHIRHPSLAPRDISRELDLEADESFGVGEPRRSRGGTQQQSTHSETYWAAALDPGQWLATISPTGPADVPRSAQRMLARRSRGQSARQYAARELHQAAVAVSTLAGAQSLSFMLSAVCGRLYLRHGEFMRRIQDEGGSITLRATVAPRALQSVKLLPQVSQWLGELGMTLELECLER